MIFFHGNEQMRLEGKHFYQRLKTLVNPWQTSRKRPKPERIPENRVNSNSETHVWISALGLSRTSVIGYVRESRTTAAKVQASRIFLLPWNRGTARLNSSARSQFDIWTSGVENTGAGRLATTRLIAMYEGINNRYNIERISGTIATLFEQSPRRAIHLSRRIYGLPSE